MGQESRSAAAARDPEAIRAGIEEARAEIAASMLALREEVDERLDWRQHVRRNPWAAIGVAFALGWVLGRRSTRNEERQR